MWPSPAERPDTADRVTPVELFFDVVFVLTITQLARLLEADLHWTGLGRTVLIFGLLWYLYTGYVWLTNHVPPRRPGRKLLLFAGMAGFLITAVALPDALTGSGLLFGVGYLVVVLVHLTLFARSTARAGVRRLAPYNLGAAALVIAAGLLTGPAVPALWIAAVLTQSVLPYLTPRHSWIGVAASFQVNAAYFVERHGLLLIVALGETVIAIGMGVPPDHLGPGTVGAVVLALALPAALWWTYFTDTPRTEHALADAAPATRTRLTAHTYVFGHFVLLLGVVLTATGLHAVVAHPDEPSGWPAALALSGGPALFLAGMADARRTFGTGRRGDRLAVAALILLTLPVGATVNGSLHLAVVTALLTVMLVADRRRHDIPAVTGVRRAGRT
ncbi:Low temperature requirement protein LtrA [Micromonospora purpureochromogenes]|uniref:Low temperature requirement protein LtrA n=1 Tax=Micromonospora purpureochromogenes TaxID=47872 RepID=A0A1C4YTI9_9ACTN|nr:low temperature requirement protein A [Micromonospora purpureochromogenes]SCF23974.1 Low temperature requirement protein LtrA [Micromonospora purpureochromogenes]